MNNRTWIQLCTTCSPRSSFPIALSAPSEGQNYQSSSRDACGSTWEHIRSFSQLVSGHTNTHSLQNIQRYDPGGWEWDTEVSEFRALLKALSRADITESTHSLPWHRSLRVPCNHRYLHAFRIKCLGQCYDV